MILAAALLIWGIWVHRICDWLLQNDWMAINKAKRRWSHRRMPRFSSNLTDGLAWWDRHPAAYVHAGVHTIGMLILAALTPWTWWAALAVGVIHFVIDLRWPVAKWSEFVGQTPLDPTINPVTGYNVALNVRLWNDQVWHEVVIGILALAVAL